MCVHVNYRSFSVKNDSVSASCQNLSLCMCNWERDRGRKSLRFLIFLCYFLHDFGSKPFWPISRYLVQIKGFQQGCKSAEKLYLRQSKHIPFVLLNFTQFQVKVSSHNIYVGTHKTKLRCSYALEKLKVNILALNRLMKSWL